MSEGPQIQNRRHELFNLRLAKGIAATLRGTSHVAYWRPNPLAALGGACRDIETKTQERPEISSEMS